MMQWPLSSVPPRVNLQAWYKARRAIEAPFRCRAGDQNGCDFPKPVSIGDVKG
jgi:hypothetical protein